MTAGLPADALAARIPRAVDRWRDGASRLLPGLALAGVVAVVARVVAGALPIGGLEVLLAIVIGLLAGNLRPLPDRARAGVRFASRGVLQAGIILLGARVSLEAILAVGIQTVGLIVGLMLLALGLVYAIGRLFHLPRRLVILIAVGTAVCGNSAIAATAPVLDAEEREVSLAVGTVTLFGTLAVFLYPVLVAALQLTGGASGVWIGTAINDTSQVVAAGTAVGGTALTVATIVKLTRNALMAPLLVAISWWWSRRPDTAVTGMRAAIPTFVLGFLALAAVRSLGWIDEASASVLAGAAQVLVLVALAAVGLNTSLRDVRAIGLRPLYLGLAASTMLSVLSLGAVLLLQISPAAR